MTTFIESVEHREPVVVVWTLVKNFQFKCAILDKNINMPLNSVNLVDIKEESIYFSATNNTIKSEVPDCNFS